MKRRDALAAICAGMIFLLGIGFNPDTVGARGKERLYSPDMSLILADGRILRLSELSGTPAVIFFYNSRCGCSSFRKMMNGVYLSFRDRGLRMIGVGIRENPDTFFSFAEREGFDFVSAFDVTRKMEKNCGVYRLPLTLFVSPEGEIVGKSKGYLGREEVKEAVERLLAGR